MSNRINTGVITYKLTNSGYKHLTRTKLHHFDRGTTKRELLLPWGNTIKSRTHIPPFIIIIIIIIIIIVFIIKSFIERWTK